MYIPIPGFVHLHTFQPTDPVSYPKGTAGTASPAVAAADPAASNHAGGLVGIVLDAIARRRPLSHIDPARFDPSVHRHVRAWRRRGIDRARLVRIHVRTNGEYFGTAELGPRQHAFTGALDGGRLQLFRLM